MVRQATLQLNGLTQAANKRNPLWIEVNPLSSTLFFMSKMNLKE
jgi:hypothetical protein